MRPRHPVEDELSRRRVRPPDRRPPDGHLLDRQQADGEDGEEPVHFGWTDVLAMIIAAYQIILPILAVFLGVVGLVYLLFRLLFVR